MDLLETAKIELDELRRQRDAITAVYDAKIAIVEQTVKMLEPVYGPTPPMAIPVLDESVGITEAIETALRKYPGKLLAPTAVRDVLSDLKYKINGDNPMASVHQVLKRLIARSASPYVNEQKDGQTMYKFDPSKEPKNPRRTAAHFGNDVLTRIVAQQEAYANAAGIMNGIDLSTVTAMLAGNDPQMADVFRYLAKTSATASAEAAALRVFEVKEKK